MAKTKITLSLNELQLKAFDKIMREDLCSNRSSFVIRLIIDEYKRRELKNYKPNKAPKEILKFDR